MTVEHASLLPGDCSIFICIYWTIDVPDALSERRVRVQLQVEASWGFLGLCPIFLPPSARWDASHVSGVVMKLEHIHS